MNRIDELDFIILDGIKCCQGHPLPFGASLVGNGGINFSVNSADAEGCALQLYHSGEKEAYADISVLGKHGSCCRLSFQSGSQDAGSLRQAHFRPRSMGAER